MHKNKLSRIFRGNNKLWFGKNTGKLIVFSLILFVGGCVNLRHDVSDDENAWYPYSRKNGYVLREAVFLTKVDSGLEPERLALVPPSDANRGSGFHSSPKSIQAYKENPDKACQMDEFLEEFRINVVGIVEGGTEFVPAEIKRNSGWNIWFGDHTHDTRYGEIASGKYKGTLVDISDVSWCMKKGAVLNRYVEIKKPQ